MAAFDRDSFLTHEYDFRLAASGPVVMFRKRSVLADATALLEGRGYDVVTVDTSAWRTEADMHRDLAGALDFPDYYGRNLAALNDCLGDVVTYAYATSEAATGFVLVLLQYDLFARHAPEAAYALVDIYADQARSGALIGHRMLCLLQSDDPRLRVNPVGASVVAWNPAEWLDKDRLD